MKIGISASTSRVNVTQAAPRGMLQRQCACGGHSPGGAECDECARKKSELQRSAVNSSAPSSVPSMVHRALRSPGRPLDAGVRAMMEPKFGRDFSAVRVHTDRLAEESANSVNASAYTVGRRMVFGEGRYEPSAPQGRQLIAHELTHVVQQGTHDVPPSSIGPADDNCEREADRVSAEAHTPSFGLGRGAIGLMSQKPMVQKEDKGKHKKHPPATPPKAPAAQSKAPTPASMEGMRTKCDVKIDPRDELDFQLKKDVRTAGTGRPWTEILNQGLQAASPCLFDALKLHEEHHVRNNAAACQAFKQCVDAHSSRTLFIGDPRISHDDFVRCYNGNNNGTSTNCVADEKESYEATIKKAQALMLEPRCASEKSSLEYNIKYWESIKDHDPDCDKSSH